mmetsp:Transcript_18027/g.55206  ORF Transcript_18027/g.55206 Transcript_18027/m.55206 type:complete len:135 (-) Transcript_18027:1216-1620(-)
MCGRQATHSAANSAPAAVGPRDRRDGPLARGERAAGEETQPGRHRVAVFRHRIVVVRRRQSSPCLDVSCPVVVQPYHHVIVVLRGSELPWALREKEERQERHRQQQNKKRKREEPWSVATGMPSSALTFGLGGQ